jgi:hypothetical protein
MTKYAIRYQNSPRHVKMYRWLRHKPSVPFSAVGMWWRQRKLPDSDFDDFPRFSFGQCWGLANRLASTDMNHLYDWVEVKKGLMEKLHD